MYQIVLLIISLPFTLIGGESNSCEFSFQRMQTLDYFSTCAYEGDEKYDSFHYENIPPCQDGTGGQLAIVPDAGYFAPNCICYSSRVLFTDQTRITVTYFLDGYSSFAFGLYNDCNDYDGYWTSKSFSTKSEGWQTETVDLTGADVPQLPMYFNIIAMQDDGKVYIDRITLENVLGCSQPQNETESESVLEETDELSFNEGPFESDSCYYDFNSTYKGMELCNAGGYPEGVLLVKIPSCNTSHGVATHKYMPPSAMMTNRGLLLSSGSECHVRLWYERTSHQPGYIKVHASDGSFSMSDPASVQVYCTTEFYPDELKWQTAKIPICYNSSTPDHPVKVTVNMAGMAGQIIYIENVKITDVQNAENCYEDRIEGEDECTSP